MHACVTICSDASGSHPCVPAPPDECPNRVRDWELLPGLTEQEVDCLVLLFSEVEPPRWPVRLSPSCLALRPSSSTVKTNCDQNSKSSQACFKVKVDAGLFGLSLTVCSCLKVWVTFKRRHHVRAHHHQVLFSFHIILQSLHNSNWSESYRRRRRPLDKCKHISFIFG